MKIGILGLGQIGGSLLLSLSGKAKVACFDISPSLREEAQGFMEFLPYNEEELFSWAKIILLAVPIREIIRVLPYLKIYEGKLFIDTGSTKEGIMEEAGKHGVKFIGGHPLAGTDKRGREAWQEGLFQDRPFYLFEGKLLDTDDKEKAAELVDLLGAKPIWWEPSEHDRVMALVSHIPYIISLALVSSCQNVKDRYGPGFLSATRLARQEPRMGADILLTQRRIPEAIEVFQQRLSEIEDLVKQGKEEELVKLIEQLSRMREGLC